MKSLADLTLTEKPFPHLVVDDFLDPELAEQCAREFPRVTKWHQHGGGKQSCSEKLDMGDACHSLSWALCTEAGRISRLTGIPDLDADVFRRGAGMHRTPRGGRLGMHVDFNQLDHLHNPMVGPWYRRVNAFIYLTPDWQEDWGGHLVLSERQDGGETVRIAPKFNRFVLFVSSETSWHGHPEPLTCPPGIWRQSLAVYYYTRERPEWARERHSTIYADGR